MAGDELGTVTLYRFDSKIDTKPHYTKFTVPYKDSTVINVLTYIHENLDSTLAFRKACNKGICRCCIIQVNGKPVMPCMEQASKYMKIGPHPKFEVIKDLVVNFDRPKISLTKEK